MATSSTTATPAQNRYERFTDTEIILLQWALENAPSGDADIAALYVPLLTEVKQTIDQRGY